MKRQTQTTGIRYWYGDDFLALQNELYKALDGFFTQYGNYVLSGCQITPNGNRYDLSRGLMALTGTDAEGQPARMIVPFEGVQNVALPVYFTLGCETVTRSYKDGGVKPVSYAYKAVASTVQPAGECLTVSQPDVLRFTDVIQDAKHRFVTDTEREAWNGKETPQGAQQKADSALQAAKDYADDTANIIGESFYHSATDYFDKEIARLINQAPAALDTFKELADALGNDPNFATTILDQLGQKAQALSTVTYENTNLVVEGGKIYWIIFSESIEGLSLNITGFKNFSTATCEAYIIAPGNIPVNFPSKTATIKNLASLTGTSTQRRVYRIKYLKMGAFEYFIDGNIYDLHW